MKRAERRIADARERMLDTLVRGGADPEALEIIQCTAESRGRIRDIWARFTGRNIELIAREMVR